MRDGGCRARPVARSAVCELVGSHVLRAAFSPAAALLLLLVMNLPATCLVCCTSGATCCSIHMHQCCLLADAAWCLSVVNCFVVMLMTRPSSLVVVSSTRSTATCCTISNELLCSLALRAVSGES